MAPISVGTTASVDFVTWIGPVAERISSIAADRPATVTLDHPDPDDPDHRTMIRITVETGSDALELRLEVPMDAVLEAAVS